MGTDVEPRPRRQWSALQLVALIELLVVAVVGAIAWWPADSASQSPLGLADGLTVIGWAVALTSPLVVGAALAARSRRPVVATLLTTVLLLVAGFVGLVASLFAALARLEDQHEA